MITCVCVCLSQTCVCFAVFILSHFFSLCSKSFVKPEISVSVPACPLPGLQASLQTILCELQDVKFAIYLGGRLSETHV